MTGVQTCAFRSKSSWLGSLPPITFTNEDFVGVDPNQDDLMVIIIRIANWDVKKVLIDQGSLTRVLFLSAFKRLDISLKLIKPHQEPLLGFTKGQVHTCDYVELETTFGVGKLSQIVLVQYIIVDANTSCNILIKRPSLDALGAIVFTPHLAMKFPNSKHNIITIKANKKEAQECYAKSLQVLAYRV